MTGVGTTDGEGLWGTRKAWDFLYVDAKEPGEQVVGKPVKTGKTRRPQTNASCERVCAVCLRRASSPQPWPPRLHRTQA